MSCVPLPPGLSPPQRRSCHGRGLTPLPDPRPGDIVSKSGGRSQAGLPPSLRVPHRSLPQHGIRVISTLFSVTLVVRAAVQSVTVAPVMPEPSRS